MIPALCAAERPSAICAPRSIASATAGGHRRGARTGRGGRDPRRGSTAGLDRDAAIEPRVAGAVVDLADPSDADEGLDLVRTEPGADGEGQERPAREYTLAVLESLEALYGSDDVTASSRPNHDLGVDSGPAHASLGFDCQLLRRTPRDPRRVNVRRT